MGVVQAVFGRRCCTAVCASSDAGWVRAVRVGAEQAAMLQVPVLCRRGFRAWNVGSSSEHKQAGSWYQRKRMGSMGWRFGMSVMEAGSRVVVEW